jgi:hypothetical protein
MLARHMAVLRVVLVWAQARPATKQAPWFWHGARLKTGRGAGAAARPLGPYHPAAADQTMSGAPEGKQAAASGVAAQGSVETDSSVA